MLQRFLIFFIFFIALGLRAQSLLPSDFDGQPWFRHPDFNPAATDADRRLAYQLAVSPRYHTFVLLMPHEFRFLSSLTSPRIRRLVDGATTRILQTSTGRKMCAQVTGGETQRIKDYFGVSASTAQSLTKACTPSTPVKLASRRERQREYVFIQTNETSHPLEGWTTPFNVTYIYLTPNDFNESFLYRVLTHELATKLDVKEQWAWIGSLDFLAENLGVKYDGSKSCEVQAAIRHPLIKYALSSLRAEQIENQILSELGLLKTTPKISSSCQDEVLSKVPSILRIGPILQLERTFQQIIGNHCGLNQESNVFEMLETITQEQVMVLETHQRVSVCDFLREAKVSSFVFSPFMGGPRPRVGPWADKASALRKDPSLRNAETANKLDQVLRNGIKEQKETDQELKEILYSESKKTTRPRTKEEEKSDAKAEKN